jgi:hypothetical protein
MPYPQISPGRISATVADIAKRYNRLAMHYKTILSEEMALSELMFLILVGAAMPETEQYAAAGPPYP